MPVELRDAGVEDLPAVRAINEESVPAMNSLPPERFAWFLEQASYFRVAAVDGEVAGFLICLHAQAEYDSPNFRWLKRRCGHIFYIDRIAIGRKFRRRGLGRALYRDAEASAVAAGYELIACEVNLSRAIGNRSIFTLPTVSRRWAARTTDTRSCSSW